MRFGGRAGGYEARYGKAAVWLKDTADYVAEGEALAKAMSCKFIETSAKTRTNVDNAFFDIVREIRRYNKEMSSYGSGAPMGMNGPKHEMEMGDREGQSRGCCGSCVLM